MHGFTDCTRSAQVLSRETHYNHDFQPFDLLCISRALDGEFDRPANETSPHPVQRSESLQDCLDAFNATPAHAAVLAALMQHASEFNATYVLAPGFENHAAQRIRDLATLSVQSLPSISPRGGTKPSIAVLANVVLISAVYQKIWAFGLGLNNAAERELTAMMPTLKSLSLAEFGVNQEFICDLHSASAALERVGPAKTPLEKTVAIRTALSEISANIEAARAIERLKSPKVAVSTALSAISSDDLLPLLAAALVQAQLDALVTTAWFLTTFPTESGAADELAFASVSFCAAVGFLQSMARKPEFVRQRSARQGETSSGRSAVQIVRKTSETSLQSLATSGAPVAVGINLTKVDSRPRAPQRVIEIDEASPEDLGEFLNALRRTESLTPLSGSGSRPVGWS
eukprot:TRINITY_DN3315_c0_g1_i3.p1 TRINITY_DN3315_c0_g1~~TRINITY_DN3315_c0_g1_i3.p1  ORF type:complete len:401 (+),score=53.59 TRINITY_DN3315_c0_g1_i3:406-1608(+)